MADERKGFFERLGMVADKAVEEAAIIALDVVAIPFKVVEECLIKPICPGYGSQLCPPPDWHDPDQGKTENDKESNNDNSCKTCYGKGHMTCKKCSGSGGSSKKCEHCGGTGKLKCSVCNGTGKVNDSKK